MATVQDFEEARDEAIMVLEDIARQAGNLADQLEGSGYPAKWDFKYFKDRVEGMADDADLVLNFLFKWNGKSL